MVTQILLHPRCLVVGPFQAEHLRRTGLAGRHISGASEGTRAGSLRVDSDHRLLDDFDMLAFPGQDAQGFRLDHRFLAGATIGNVLHEVRPEHDPVIGDDRGRLRQLDRRVGVIALADTDRDRFAGKPLLLLRPLETTLLPLRRRQYAFRLPFDVHSRPLTEAQLTHETRDAVDAHIVGKHVVIGIAGMNDRLVHVYRTVTALLVIAELVPAEIEETRVGDGLSGRPLAGFERCQGHERLERRTRRISTVERPVEQGLVG